MVSAGDADISLHIRPGPISNLGGVGGGGAVFWGNQNSKYFNCQDLPKFEFSVGGYSGEVKTQSTLCAKICLILKFQLGGGAFSGSQN